MTKKEIYTNKVLNYLNIVEYDNIPNIARNTNLDKYTISAIIYSTPQIKKFAKRKGQFLQVQYYVEK